MHFAPDTEYSLQFAVVLANTVASASPSGTDELATVEQLASLIHQFGFSGRLDDDEAELAGVRDIRSRIREMWLLERDEAVQVINTTLRQAQALPYLARHDQFDWHLHATDPEAPLAERIGVEVALALVDVIRTGETGRLRSCAAGDCSGVFLDLSRNGSKRFCSVRCGNRMNMIAFRERAAATPAPDAPAHGRDANTRR